MERATKVAKAKSGRPVAHFQFSFICTEKYSEQYFTNSQQHLTPPHMCDYVHVCVIIF